MTTFQVIKTNFASFWEKVAESIQILKKLDSFLEDESISTSTNENKTDSTIVSGTNTMLLLLLIAIHRLVIINLSTW